MQATERTIKTILPISMEQTEIPKTRYAPYCRVSSDSSDQEQSFAAQVRYYTEAIEKMDNATLVDIYADEAISGRNTKKREDFNRLISDCKKGKIDRVITKSVSRFARNTVDCLETVRLLTGYGVSILFEKEGLDTATMPSEILLAMSGTQAQDESISHGNNMRWSYKRRMESGNFLGCTSAFGYTVINSGEHIINEDEAKIVNQIKDLYLSGWGKQKIANHLNEQGLSNRGSKWCAFAIDYILNNERYIGDALLQKKMTTQSWPPKRITNDGSMPQYYVENAIPAIWTKEDRNAILTLQASRRQSEYKRGGHNLSKMLICSECGHPYRRIQKKNKIVWGCSYMTKGATKCESFMLDENDVENAFIRCVNTLRNHYGQILIPLIDSLENLQGKLNGSQMKLYEIDSQIAKLSKKSLVIAELLSNGILDNADFAAQNRELGEKINSLRSKRRECLRQNEQDDKLTELIKLISTFESMDNDITEFDETIIKSVIKNATVLSNTEIIIHLHGGLDITEKLPNYYNRRCKRK